MAGDASIGFPIFVARGRDHVRRESRSWGLFVPADAFEIVANVLLVEGGLRFAGRVLVGGPETRRVWRERFVDPDEFAIEKAEFEFCVGDDDAAGGGVFRSLAVNREADVAQLLGEGNADARNRLVERNIFIVAGGGLR